MKQESQQTSHYRTLHTRVSLFAATAAFHAALMLEDRLVLMIGFWLTKAEMVPVACHQNDRIRTKWTETQQLKELLGDTCCTLAPLLSISIPCLLPRPFMPAAMQMAF